MPLVTSFERLAREEGYAEGREEIRRSLGSSRDLLIDILQIRWGEIPPQVLQAILSESNSEALREWTRNAVRCKTLEEWTAQEA